METKKLTEIITYNSSTISKSEFNFVTGHLVIEFMFGSHYEYENVRIEDYLAFSTAESVGKSFAQWIRSYEGKKLSES
jgi:hypothetical protein